MTAKKLFLLILLIVLCTPAAGVCRTENSLSQRFESANQKFTGSLFAEAISEYEGITAEAGLSSNVLHNLGNSYAATGQNGLAMLSYYRGLRLSPGDDDLKASIDLLKENIGLFEEETTLKEQLLGYYTLNQWAYIALGGYVALTMFLLFNYFYPVKRGLKRGSLLLATLICLSCLGAYQQFGLWKAGVVISPESRVLISPFPDAASQGILKEGSMVYPQKQHGSFTYILDDKGRSGWISSEAFKQINTHHLTYSQDSVEQ